MPLPDNYVELQLAGYRPAGSGICGKCSARLEWFLTPANRKMPFSLKVDLMVNAEGGMYLKPSLNKLEPHFGACPDVERVRRRKR